VDFYPRHKSVLASKPSKFEQVSELVRKVFTSFLLLPPLISPKCGVNIDGLILESPHPSVCSVEIKHVSLWASSGNNLLNYKS
jgi:hypothetical protein